MTIEKTFDLAVQNHKKNNFQVVKYHKLSGTYILPTYYFKNLFFKWNRNILTIMLT